MNKIKIAILFIAIASQANAQQVDINGPILIRGTLSGSMFSDDTPPAVIQRIADRVLIGGAVIADGKRFPVTTTWVAQQASGFMTYFDSRSTAEVVSPKGATAIAGASRTSDMNPADTGTIGFLGFALNDYLNATPASRRSAWGNYTHVVRAADGAAGAIAGGIQGMEIAVANLGSAVDVDPYGGGNSQSGMTLGILIGAGGETGFDGETVNPSSAALMITNNHAQHRKGLVIGANSINGADGTTGTAPAIVMAKGHEIQWRYSAGDITPALGATIRSDNNALGTSTKLIFRTNGAAFTDQFENQIVRFQPSNTTNIQTTNYSAFINAIAGSGSPNPVIAATGTDPTIGLDFQTTSRGNYNFYNLAHTRLLARIADIGSLSTNGNSIIINGNDTGATPTVASGGVDTNIDLGFTAKGTGSIVFNALAKLKSYTVATLPTCNAGLQDAMAIATDTTSPTYNSALIGSGAIRVPVYCNGTIWTSH